MFSHVCSHMTHGDANNMLVEAKTAGEQHTAGQSVSPDAAVNANCCDLRVFVFSRRPELHSRSHIEKRSVYLGCQEGQDNHPL